MGCSCSKIMKEPATDIFYPVRIYRKIATYIQDSLAEIFPWMVRNTKTLEILESRKNRLNYPANRDAAQLFLFIAICTFIIVLILSMKNHKDEDDDIEDNEDTESISEVPTNNQPTCESNDGSVCSVPIGSIENANCDNLSVGTNDLSYHTLSEVNDSIPPSIVSMISVRDSESHITEQLQKKSSILTSRNRVRPRIQAHRRQSKKSIDDDSLIKRTRSGHIYGKYLR